MIWVLFILIVLFVYLYTNDKRKEEEKVEKKPDVDWYIKKINDIFYERKIAYDKRISLKETSFHFSWKYYKLWKTTVFGCVSYWWNILDLLEAVYNNYDKETDTNIW